MKQRFNAIALNREVSQKPGMTKDRRIAIKRFMADRKLKTAPWAKAAGVAEGTLRDYLSGRNTTMTLEKLDRLADAADAVLTEMIGEKIQQPRIGKDIVTIKSLEVRASMGGGFEVVEEPDGPPFFFRRGWIDKILEGKPGQMRVLPDLGGDSMYPTINDGDIGLILLPSEETKFQSGAIYALWDGQGLLVKRLESLAAGDKPRLRVISDNRSLFPPYDVDPEDVRIIGQLVWRGGRI